MKRRYAVGRALRVCLAIGAKFVFALLLFPSAAMAATAEVEGSEKSTSPSTEYVVTADSGSTLIHDTDGEPPAIPPKDLNAPLETAMQAVAAPYEPAAEQVLPDPGGSVLDPVSGVAAGAEVTTWQLMVPSATPLLDADDYDGQIALSGGSGLSYSAPETGGFSLTGVPVLSDLDNDGIADADDPVTVIASHTYLNPGIYRFIDLLVTNNAVLKTGSDENLAGFQGVVIKCVNLVIDAGATISANREGHTGGQGPGAGAGGNTVGGGGHGGAGGGTGTAGGSAYGLANAPTAPGSGGGNGACGTGGSGGGALRIDVSGTMTVNGILSANGGSGCGGGSGGSIFITAGTLGGAGTITANGGSASDMLAAGGGGRIAIYFAATASLPVARITAAGGLGGNAGAGTVIYEYIPDALLQTDGAGYFDEDGFTILPFQRNLVPYGDMLTDGGSGYPPGWTWEKHAGTVVNIAPSVTADGVRFKVTAGANGGWAALKYEINAARNWRIDSRFVYDPAWDRTLEVGDRLAMAANITVHNFSGTANHSVTLFDLTTWQYRSSGNNGAVSGRFQTADGYGPLTDGYGSFRVPLGSQKLVCGIYVWLPALGDMIEVTISEVVAQRINPHAWQGTKGYTTAPAHLGDVGVFREQNAPPGVATRRDGIGFVEGAVAGLDLTRAWWSAVTFIPAWDSDLKNQLDGDLINIQADQPYQNIAGAYLFKKPTSPTPEDPGLWAQPPNGPPIENYFIYAHWDGCTNTTRLHLGNFTFVEGDEIKVIMAFLPQGAEGIAPGHHIWLRTRDDTVITASDSVTVTNDRQDDTITRVMLGYQNQIKARAASKADEEFAAWGKFRQWYAQQGTISLTEVYSYMGDNTSLGVRKAGVYFPLTAESGMTGYGNSPASLSVDFTADVRSGSAPLTVSFADLSVARASKASWLWSFGDGRTSTLQHPVHRYDVAGSYAVSLTVADVTGAVKSLTRSGFITVSGSGSSYRFEDDFSDGAADGWTPQQPGDWTVANASGDNVYRATNTRWFSQGWASQWYSGSWAGPTTLGDQIIEADVSVTAGGIAALIFRGSGDIYTGSYYYFGIYPDQDKWKLFSVNNGNWGNTASPPAQGNLAIDPGTFYRLRVEAIGSSITLYINGQKLTPSPVIIGDHPVGRFGFWMAMGQAGFDDILVVG